MYIITAKNANDNYFGFKSFFNPQGLLNVTSFDGAEFGKAAAVIGGVHVVTYYGKSNNGTVYVYSKDGIKYKPEVKSLKTVIQQMGDIRMNTSPIKYYKK
jgi:hypothetical protein